jgi:hypothetical protein
LGYSDWLDSLSQRLSILLTFYTGATLPIRLDRSTGVDRFKRVILQDKVPFDNLFSLIFISGNFDGRRAETGWGEPKGLLNPIGSGKPHQIAQPSEARKGPNYCSISEILGNKSPGDWPKKENIPKKKPTPHLGCGDRDKACRGG